MAADISAWYVVSTVLFAGVWLDARRRAPLWGLGAVVCATIVSVTLVGIVPYVVARMRRGAEGSVG